MFGIEAIDPDPSNSFAEDLSLNLPPDYNIHRVNQYYKTKLIITLSSNKPSRGYSIGGDELGPGQHDSFNLQDYHTHPKLIYS